MPKYVGMTEALHREIFDTEYLSQNSTDFFDRPWGVKGKTFADTSMRMSRMLPVPERFTLKAMPEVALIKNGKLLTVFESPIWTESVFRFIVNSKIYLDAPLWTLAHPICVIGGIEKFLQLKQSERDDFFRLRVLAYDVPINTYTNSDEPDPFYATIDTKIPDKSVRAYVGLPGIYERAI